MSLSFCLGVVCKVDDVTLLLCYMPLHVVCKLVCGVG